jgi:replicative DNA helicase
VRPDEPLDVAALRALVGEASVGLDVAAELLDASGAEAEDLAEVELRPLFAVVADRVRRRVPVDYVEFKAALPQVPARVHEVAVDVVTEVALGVTAQRLALLREAGVRRRFIEALRAAAVAAQRGAPLGELERLVRDVPGLLQASGRVRSCAGDAVALRDHLQRGWTSKAPRLMTGFDDLDEVLGGLVNNLIVIGARTAVGKSALVAGLVRNWLSQGVKTGLIAYEDDARDLEARLVACEAGVGLKHARGDLLPNEAQRSSITDGLEWLSRHEHLLETDDARPAGRPSDVIASMRAMRRRGCQVVLLDNLTCTRMDGGDERHDLVVERALSDIRAEAQRLQVPAFVVGHVKRGQGDTDEAQRCPRLSDFRNASAWENYSRIALGMWLDGDQVALRVLKQTNGPAGDDFTVEFRKEAAVVVGMARRLAAPAAPRTPPQRPTYQRPPARYAPDGDE